MVQVQKILMAAVENAQIRYNASQPGLRSEYTARTNPSPSPSYLRPA
jgi:hypothetical protein